MNLYGQSQSHSLSPERFLTVGFDVMPLCQATRKGIVRLPSKGWGGVL